MRASALALAFLLVGCGGAAVKEDGGAPVAPMGAPDAGVVVMPSGGMMSGGGGEADGHSMPLPDGGLFGVPKGGTFTPPSSSNTPVVHGAPSPLAGAVTLLAGEHVLDVSTDRGGGVWAVTAQKVFYLPPGRTQPFTYDQSNGLARGWTTWKDIYYSGTEAAPQTFPVTFSAIGGGLAGQAIVGNVGAIADLLEVDPATGAVQKIVNMQVTPANSSAAEYPEHLKRVVATHKVLVDLNGTLDGTAYIGGWHGFEAFHGLAGDCGCMQFEEHQHFIPDDSMGDCDSSGEANGCWDGDVWGLALSPTGDVWAGDRHFVQLLKQRSLGPNTGFFDTGVVWEAGLDVFPGVRDEVHGLAVDAAGGVYVASDGNGLAYLAPGTYSPTYYSSANVLPLDHLRGVAVDHAGDVWVGTDGGGVARLHPATHAWTYYTVDSGLPADKVETVYVDPYSSARRVYIATANGVSVYSGN